MRNTDKSVVWPLATALLLASFSAHTAQLSPRIIGGSVTSEKQYPFIVAISRHSKTGGDIRYHHCGGSLISSTWVLTAAHCLFKTSGGAQYSPDEISVRIGVQDLSDPDQGEHSKIKSIVVHPGYSAQLLTSDIALLELTTPLNSEFIALPALGSDVPTMNELAVVAGWGVTDANDHSDSNPVPHLLHELEVPVIAHVECVLTLAEFSQGVDLVLDTDVCAGGAASGGLDACTGDSGGPLFVMRNGMYVQAGIVSRGDGCAKPDIPGIYTRISRFTDWVSSYVPDVSINHSGTGIDRANRSLDELPLGQLSTSTAGQNGTLKRGKVFAYEISGATRVELKSLTGDANLYLFKGVEFGRNDIICESVRQTALDVCDVPDSPERQFAIIISYTDSTYLVSATESGLLPVSDDLGVTTSLANDSSSDFTLENGAVQASSNNSSGSNNPDIAVLATGVALGASTLTSGSSEISGLAILAGLILLRRRKTSSASTALR